MRDRADGDVSGHAGSEYHHGDTEVADLILDRPVKWHIRPGHFLTAASWSVVDLPDGEVREGPSGYYPKLVSKAFPEMMGARHQSVAQDGLRCLHVRPRGGVVGLAVSFAPAMSPSVSQHSAPRSIGTCWGGRKRKQKIP